MIRSTKYSHVFWKNRPGINGWGDALVRLSYFYRTNKDEPTICHYWDKLDNFKKVKFVQKHVLEPNRNFAILRPTNFQRDPVSFSSRHYMMPKHDYWPAVMQHKGLRNKKIAYKFYRDNFPKHIKLSYLELENKHYRENLDELKNTLYWAGYSMLPLYDINDYRSSEKIITDPVECINANMQLLADCELFMGSEGFMTHVARAMNVPTLVFFNGQKSSVTMQLIENFDTSLQTPVYNNEDIVNILLDKSDQFVNI